MHAISVTIMKLEIDRSKKESMLHLHFEMSRCSPSPPSLPLSSHLCSYRATHAFKLNPLCTLIRKIRIKSQIGEHMASYQIFTD